MRAQNIITLTTIPPRYGTIMPTLQSLCSQAAEISRVILVVPKNYDKRDFEVSALPDLPHGVELLHCNMDFGPATKILPTLARFSGKNVRLLYCDDDRIYHRDWAARLIALNEANADQCVVDVGEPVAVIDQRGAWDVPLHHRLNALSFGLYGKRHRRMVRAMIPNHGPVDIAKGYGGVLIRPDFFDDEVFSIPDAFWAVDDVWLSGHLARRDVIIHKAGRNPLSVPTRSRKLAALLDLEVDGHGRDKLNLACVDHFRQRYGIWGGTAAITSAV